METNNQSAQTAKDKKALTPEQQRKMRRKIRRSESAVKSYQFFLLRLALFIVVLWILFFQIVGVVICPTADMYPRVDSGDMVIYYRLDKDVRAQDVIVLQKVTEDSPDPKTFVLRVVAVAGDTVEVTDSERLVINGNTMIEPDIFYSTPRYEGFTEYPLTLGEGECFVLADSRNGGMDSRYFGPVNADEILGTVITIVRRNNL